jgi:hypothetical protein
MSRGTNINAVILNGGAYALVIVVRMTATTSSATVESLLERLTESGAA